MNVMMMLVVDEVMLVVVMSGMTFTELFCSFAYCGLCFMQLSAGGSHKTLITL